MSDESHARKAADIIAALLGHTVSKAEEEGRHLYIWEREGIEWLREQWKRDPDTQMSMWIADRYVSNAKVDLKARMTTAREKPEAR